MWRVFWLCLKAIYSSCLVVREHCLCLIMLPYVFDFAFHTLSFILCIPLYLKGRVPLLSCLTLWNYFKTLILISQFLTAALWSVRPGFDHIQHTHIPITQCERTPTGPKVAIFSVNFRFKCLFADLCDWARFCESNRGGAGNRSRDNSGCRISWRDRREWLFSNSWHSATG